MTKFYDTYHEEFTGSNNNVLVNEENERDRNSGEYMHVDVTDDQGEYQSHAYSETEPHILQDSMETGSNEMSMHMQNVDFTDQNNGIDYGASLKNGSFSSEQLRMDHWSLAIDTENHKKVKCSLINWENSSIGSRYADLNNIIPEAPLSVTVISDEDDFSQQESCSDSSPIEQESPSFQDSNSYASSSVAPALHCNSFGNIEITNKNQSNSSYSKYFLGFEVDKIDEKNIATLKNIHGYSKYPCIVCCEKGRDMRQVTGYNAYIMIYACIKKGYYLQEKGKEISRLNKFYSCRYHLDDLYNSVCKYMGIVNPITDIHARNKTVVDALPLIKEIKSSRETIEMNINLGSFVALVKKFCETYKRNYDVYTVKPVIEAPPLLKALL